MSETVESEAATATAEAATAGVRMTGEPRAPKDRPWKGRGGEFRLCTLCFNFMCRESKALWRRLWLLKQTDEWFPV